MAESRNVYQCIAAVSAELAKEGIAKDRTNQQQNYRFRGIDDVYNALAPLLAAQGLVVIPRVLSRAMTEKAARNGGTLFYVVVEAEYDFISSHDGSKVTARTFGEAMDSGDKATNKAMSAAYKYAAFQTFCIPTEGDHDSENHAPEVAVPGETIHQSDNQTAPVSQAPKQVAGAPAGETHAQKIARIKKEAEVSKPQSAAAPLPVAPATQSSKSEKSQVVGPDGSVQITGINVRNGPMVMKGDKAEPSWGPLYVITFSGKVKTTDDMMTTDAGTFDEKLAQIAESARDAAKADPTKGFVKPVVDPGKKKGSFTLTKFA